MRASIGLFRIVVLCVVASSAVPVFGAPREESFLEDYAATHGFRLGHPRQVQLTPDGDAVLFLQSGPRAFEQDLYEHDVKSGRTRVLLTAAQLLAGKGEELSAEELARRERARSTARGIAFFELSRDGKRVLVPLSGRLFMLDRASGRITELPGDGGYALDPRLSPDGKQVATVREGDLYVIDIARERQRRLTLDASETISNGIAEFVAQEEMQRSRGFWWSPDSRRLAYQRTDVSKVETLHIGDPTNPAKPAQPWRYPRPGRDNASVQLFVVPVDGGDAVEVAWDRVRFPYLAAVRWEGRGTPLTLLVQGRAQQHEKLLAVDEDTSAVRGLLSETDSAWLNIDPSAPHWLADGKSFLWTSERNGAWQLEKRAHDGTLQATLTSAEFGYRELLGVDETQGCAHVIAAADPRQAQVYCVPLDPHAGAPRALVSEPGISNAVFARRSGIWVHEHRPPSGAPRHDVRDSNGRVLATLPSRALALPFEPKVEFVETTTTPAFHAVLTRPRDFDARRKYPVVLHVYGGPHAQMVHSASSLYLLEQWMADQGVIVVSLDGRGTPARGRAWERVIRGDFITQPLADQVAGLQALGARFPELDLQRTGVFGWSFGGYFAAMAAMRRPDVFRVAVAGAPVVDWLDYDTHYTERYLGLPADSAESYRRSSVLEYAKDLRRSLLLVHGTADDNVYFLHSAKLADRLFQEGVPFDFLPLVGRTHMVADPAATRRLYEEVMRYLKVGFGGG